MNDEKLFGKCLDYYLYSHPRDPEVSEAAHEARARSVVTGLLKRKHIAENPTDNWLNEYETAE